MDSMRKAKGEPMPNYQDLIREAFVDPIQNVVVIDDEYPTLTTLLEKGLAKNGASSAVATANIERLKSIISMCHQDHKWGVDVFDGKSPALDDQVPAHLAHSDLVILDYHLDGEPSQDDGSRSRKIISYLENNNNFNIIMVHTKGSDGEIKGVFEEILKGFYNINRDFGFSISEESEEKIESWFDENESLLGSENPNNDYELLDILQLVDCTKKRLALNYRNPNHPMNKYENKISKIINDAGVDGDDIVKWILTNKIKKVEDSFTGSLGSGLSWAWDDDDNYICTGRVFVSVVHKGEGNPKSEIYDKLCQALYKFDASPMRLLMAKMRHELDGRGIEIADGILRNRHAQAGWLYRLIEKSNKYPEEHERAINLHWEQLARASKDSIKEFSQKIVDASKNEPEKDSKAFVKRFFRECIGDQDLTKAHLNYFSCAMPVISNHLSTGMVLQCEDDIWVCLTPACDLVPRKKSNNWEDRIGENHLPFKAIRLHPVDKISTANINANTNDYIYLLINSEVKSFKFSYGNPIWDVFYSNNNGILCSDKKLIINSIRKKEIQEVGGKELVVKNYEMTAIAELRYEYALNLLQKLGANQTRVGLDFIGKDGLW